MKKWKNRNQGITLIALVITIVVILILARSNYCYADRRQWITTESFKCERRVKRWRGKRSNTASICRMANIIKGRNSRKSGKIYIR